MYETSLHADIAAPAENCIAHGLTIDRARDLLDWLEAHGISSAEVSFDSTDHVAILLKC